MRIGLSLPTYGAFPVRPWQFFTGIAGVADDGDVDTLWAPDHLALPEEDVRANGGRTRVDEPFDAWTLLAMLASRTRRVRVGTEVTPLPLRAPALLAKAVATLDLLSGGRTILGLGAGWYSDEFAEAGVPFLPYRKRLEQTREGAGYVKRLLSGERVQAVGAFYELAGATAVPLRREGRVPMWFGGRSETILGLVAELGDGWIAATNASPGEIEKSLRLLEKLLVQAGRARSDITVAVPFISRVASTTERARDDLEAYIARGAFEGFVKEFLEDATRRHGIWGSPEDCLRKLDPYRRLGVDHAILDIRPPDFALDSSERICEELIPRLSETEDAPSLIGRADA